MDAKKFATVLISLGIALLIISLIWWGNFYSGVERDTIKCLYSSGGLCDVATFFGGLTDMTPYNPAVFWCGISSFLVGIIILLSLKEENKN